MNNQQDFESILDAYPVKLEVFEGPLDLLLHLVKRNEVEIYDIPIATITEQYVEYIEMMKDMNLDVAGEFILMAATLVHIKSKMLLPMDAEAEEAEEGPDPREELVRRLLEYQRYKEAAEELYERNLLGRDVFTRGHAPGVESMDEGGLVNVNVFELMEALKGIIERAPRETAMELTAERFRIADKINYVLDMLGAQKSMVFTSLFPERATRGEIIVTFLAVLELAKLLLIKVYQTEDGIIRVYSHAPEKREGREGEGGPWQDNTP